MMIRKTLLRDTKVGSVLMEVCGGLKNHTERNEICFVRDFPHSNAKTSDGPTTASLASYLA